MGESRTGDLQRPEAEAVGRFREALQGEPSLARSIWHDPSAVLGEFRCHNTVLHLASDQQYGDPDCLALARLVLEHGADPNARNDLGWTPLHYACALDARDKDLVALLIGYGADPNAATNDGQTPLELAFGGARDGEAIRAMLVAHGARPLQIKNARRSRRGRPRPRT